MQKTIPKYRRLSVLKVLPFWEYTTLGCRIPVTTSLLKENINITQKDYIKNSNKKQRHPA